MAYLICSAGAAVLAVSAFLPQRSPASDTLWQEGTGWGFVIAVPLFLWLTRRAVGRGGFSWAGLWVGGLAVLNAIAMAADSTFQPLGAGIYALGVGGMLVLAGWCLLYATARPTIRGVGSVSALVREHGRSSSATSPHREVVRSGGSARSPVVWSLGVYAVLSFVFWGVPVLGHFRTALIAANDIDPAQYTWFYSWWPHAVFHGMNPFLTTAILAPDGYNLSWATAVPGPSLLASPLTALFGAVVTYNVLALAAPALAAWTAFLLCRHLTGRTAPSLVAGYVFGFSPYMLRMLQGSPDLFFVALVPLLALLVIRNVEGSISDRVFLIGMTISVAFQFVTTVELVATSSIFGGSALLAAFALCPERRTRLLGTLRLLAVSYLGAAVLVSPMIYFMLFHGHTTPYNNGPLLASDLLSWIYPDPALAAATTHQLSGTPGYFGGLAYFTAPLLAVIGAWSWQRRHDRHGVLLAVCFAVPAVFSLGSLLRVHDHLTRVGLPWSDLAHFPGLRLLIPQRFAMFGFLAAALIVALWLAALPSALRWGLVLLAVVMMVPNVGSAVWDTPIHDPSFFTGGSYRGYLRPSDRVITVPSIGENMRWQAEAHFGFQIAGGGLGTFPASYLRYPTFVTLLSGQLTPHYAADLRRFIADKGVTAVVISKRFLAPQWLRLFATLRVPPVDTGGVLFYRISGADPHGVSRIATQ